MFTLAMEAKKTRDMGVVGSTSNILDFIASKVKCALDKPFADKLQVSEEPVHVPVHVPCGHCCTFPSDSHCPGLCFCSKGQKQAVGTHGRWSLNNIHSCWCC